MKKKFCIIAVCIFFILPLDACSINNSDSNQYEQSFITMDTPMQLSAYGANAKMQLMKVKKDCMILMIWQALQ